VCSLASGVYRNDIPLDFELDAAAFQMLIDSIDDTLQFTLTVEGKLRREEVLNYQDVRGEIVRRLENLRDSPLRKERPLLYHLDVAAMYPNIILTNRLQPAAIVNDEVRRFGERERERERELIFLDKMARHTDVCGVRFQQAGESLPATDGMDVAR
jgi:hypothetical protein